MANASCGHPELWLWASIQAQDIKQQAKNTLGNLRKTFLKFYIKISTLRASKMICCLQIMLKYETQVSEHQQ